MSTEPRPHPPVPTSVSEHAQRYLGQENPFGASGWPADMSDVEAVERVVAVRDQAMVEVIGSRLPPNLPVDEDRFEIDGVTTYTFRPHHVTDPDSVPLYFDIHGGALIMGGGDACVLMARGPACARTMISWSVDYRMPPRHPYPAGLDDCLTAYRRALEVRDPSRIVVGGASAGGNLAAALLLRARDEGLPMPAALVLLSPEVDLTESGDSFTTNLGIDHVLGPLMDVNRLYAGGHDLAHPYLSPLLGDLTGFPPTFLQTGTRDLFLSNTVRFHRKLRAAGVEADLHVWEAMPHGGLGGSPEDMEIGVEVGRFLARHLASG